MVYMKYIVNTFLHDSIGFFLKKKCVFGSNSERETEMKENTCILFTFFRLYNFDNVNEKRG